MKDYIIFIYSSLIFVIVMLGNEVNSNNKLLERGKLAKREEIITDITTVKEINSPEVCASVRYFVYEY